MNGFTAWDPIAPLSAPEREGLGAYVDDRFCVPEAADDAALDSFLPDYGPAGETGNANMSGVVAMPGFTEWDGLAVTSANKFPRQDLRLSGQLSGRLTGGLGGYEEFEFCRPMPYEDPPAGLAGLGGCCQSCDDRSGPCEGCAGGGLAGLGAFGLPTWMTNPQGLQEYALLAGIGVIATMVLTPLIFPTGAKGKARRAAVKKARLRAKARRAQIAAEFA